MTEGFARDGIAYDGAIALKNSHWDGDVDQFVGGRVFGGGRFGHWSEYIIRETRTEKRSLQTSDGQNKRKSKRDSSAAQGGSFAGAKEEEKAALRSE